MLKKPRLSGPAPTDIGMFAWASDDEQDCAQEVARYRRLSHFAVTLPWFITSPDNQQAPVSSTSRLQ